MNKLIVIVLVLGCYLSIPSCTLFRGEDDELNIERFDGDMIPIKLNGYYYNMTSSFDKDLYHIYFFYTNGITCYIGSYPELEIDSSSWGFLGQTSWGIFNIEGDDFLFEKWYPSSGGPAPAYVRHGEILTDTSFHITRSYRIVDGEETEIDEKDEIYYFMELSAKPDSLNDFIN